MADPQSPPGPETLLPVLNPPERKDPFLGRTQAQSKSLPTLQTPTHAPLAPSPPLLLLSLSSFTHSAAAPSAPQLSRSTALSHNSAHTRTHAQLPAVSHTARRLFQYQVRLLPGDGRCSSRVSASSERRRRVLLIRDAAGSLPLFLFLSQEPSYIDASIRDLKTFDQDITCAAFVILGGGGGLRGVEDFSGRALLSAASMRL